MLINLSNLSMQRMHEGQPARCGTSEGQRGPHSTYYCITWQKILHWLDGTHTLRNGVVGGALELIMIHVKCRLDLAVSWATSHVTYGGPEEILVDCQSHLNILFIAYRSFGKKSVLVSISRNIKVKNIDAQQKIRALRYLFYFF